MKCIEKNYRFEKRGLINRKGHRIFLIQDDTEREKKRRKREISLMICNEIPILPFIQINAMSLERIETLIRETKIYK